MPEEGTEEMVGPGSRTEVREWETEGILFVLHVVFSLTDLS